MGEPEPDHRVISYVLAGTEPSHDFGTIIKSRLTDWEIAKETFYVPEQVEQADVMILVGGFEGTFRAANWGRIAQKPLLPFTGFGGAAEKIYTEELNHFEEKYAGLVEPLEYEQLNSMKSDWHEHATDLLALAEKGRRVTLGARDHVLRRSSRTHRRLRDVQGRRRASRLPGSRSVTGRPRTGPWPTSRHLDWRPDLREYLDQRGRPKLGDLEVAAWHVVVGSPS
jgi:hypothetical protein